MIRNFNRFVTKCFRYGEIENLDEEIFRKEREAQYEEAFHSSKRNKKKTKGQIQQVPLFRCLRHTASMSSSACPALL